MPNPTLPPCPIHPPRHHTNSSLVKEQPFEGSTAAIIGSALWVAGMDPDLEGSDDDRLATIQSMIFNEYEEQEVPHQVRIRKLTWSMICSAREIRNPAAYPELHSCKAAQIRHLAGPVRAVIERLNKDGRHDHLVQVMQQLERFYLIIDSYGPSIPLESATELFDRVHSCCVHYCCLASDAAARGLKLFKITPKFHFWLHIAYYARFVNPRFAWTYADEDFVGKIAQVAHASSFGLGPLRLGPSMVHRYVLAVALRMQRRLKFHCA